MNTLENIEYLIGKLKQLEENHANLLASYQSLIANFEDLSEQHLQLQHDYECCYLDLSATRRQLYEADRDRH